MTTKFEHSNKFGTQQPNLNTTPKFKDDNQIETQVLNWNTRTKSENNNKSWNTRTKLEHKNQIGPKEANWNIRTKLKHNNQIGMQQPNGNTGGSIIKLIVETQNNQTGCFLATRNLNCRFMPFKCVASTLIFVQKFNH